MNDVSEKRVRAAAVAGWWTVLFAVGFVVIQWIAYLLVMSAHPAWMLAWCGPDITWSFFQTVWFWTIAILKACVWLLILVALWLTLWAKQLRKRAERIEVKNGG
jgi:MFS family permease